MGGRRRVHTVFHKWFRYTATYGNCYIKCKGGGDIHDFCVEFGESCREMRPVMKRGKSAQF